MTAATAEIVSRTLAAVSTILTAVASVLARRLQRSRATWKESLELETLKKTVREGTWTGFLAPESLLLDQV